jgi:predicted dehydrogenase
MTLPRAAIIGAGFMGGAHTEALRRSGIEVNGILGCRPGGKPLRRQRLGLPRAYASFEEVCQDPGVDIVHLCTPNYLHYDQARAAMLAGKHVLCEKPLAMDAAESAELVALARECRRVGAVNYNLRYYPLCQEGPRPGAIRRDR